MNYDYYVLLSKIIVHYIFAAYFIFYIFFLPVIYFVRYNRYYSRTQPRIPRYIAGATQGLLLIGFVYLIAFIIFFSYPIYFRVNENVYPYNLYLIPIICEAITPHRLNFIYNKKWGNAIFYLTSIPVDLVMRCHKRGIEPAVFFERQDEELYHRALRFWKENRNDAPLIDGKRAPDEAYFLNTGIINPNSEQIGQILGYYVDKNFEGHYSKPTYDLFSLPHHSVIIGGRLLFYSYLLFLALVVSVKFWSQLGLPNATDTQRIIELSLFYIFGSIFSQDSAARLIGAVLLANFFFFSFVREAKMKNLGVMSICVYFFFSIDEISRANTQWEALIVFRLSSFFDGIAFKFINNITSGLAAFVKGILSLSLSNIFGFSIMLWSYYVGAVVMRAYGRPGRRFYDRVLTRPAALGAPRK